MSVEYRKDRGCWTYRVYRSGKRYKGYGYATKTEAREAERKFLVELGGLPKIQPSSLRTVAAQFAALIASRRSASRSGGLQGNLENYILPYFGAATPVASITPKQIEDFVDHWLPQRKPMTVWHYVKDLKATLNYAVRQGLLADNPCVRADLSKLSNRVAPKPPLNRELVEKQAQVLAGRERLYFDTLRYMGLRKDEANSIRRSDLLDSGELWLHVRGTKTAGSDRWLPVPPALSPGYLAVLGQPGPDEYVFGFGNRKKYDRRKLFAKAAKLSSTSPLKPKDLRDYFASIMHDATVASKMLGHKSLRTTEIYTRQVRERMISAVKELGCQATSPMTVEPTNPKRPSTATASGENAGTATIQSGDRPSGPTTGTHTSATSMVPGGAPSAGPSPDLGGKGVGR